MAIIDFNKSLKFEVQRDKDSTFEIYSYRKDVNGQWQYLECFLTDMFGRVFEYEVWSDTLQEFITVNLATKKSDYYKDRFAEIRDDLKLAIVEHECNKGVAL